MLMTAQTWKSLKFFKRDEMGQNGTAAFPQPENMDYDLMIRIDQMRNWVGRPFIVHSSTGGEHEARWHGTGVALDGHFVGLTAAEQYLQAEQWNWPGLGFYPHWHDPGIHIDTRPHRPNEKGARWWQNEIGIYLGVTPGVIAGEVFRP